MLRRLRTPAGSVCLGRETVRLERIGPGPPVAPGGGGEGTPMRSFFLGNRTHGGYSLLEIMVVVLVLSVCVAGATGWAGRAVAEAVLAAEDLRLRSAVSRSAAGQDLGQAWGGEPVGVAGTAPLAAREQIRRNLWCSTRNASATAIT